MIRRIIYFFLLLVSFAFPASSQSFADAVKDGFSPLNALLKKGNAKNGGNEVNAEIKKVVLKDGTEYEGEMKGKRPHGTGKAQDGDQGQHQGAQGQHHRVHSAYPRDLCIP